MKKDFFKDFKEGDKFLLDDIIHEFGKHSTGTSGAVRVDACGTIWMTFHSEEGVWINSLTGGLIDLEKISPESDLALSGEVIPNTRGKCVHLLWVTPDNGEYNPCAFLAGVYHFKKSAEDRIKEMKVSGTYIDAEYFIEERKII